MKRTIIALTLSTAILLPLAACEGTHMVNERELRYGAHYWQRSNPTDSTFVEGPKSQQMLHRDIARCVTEIRELERLGAVKNAIPADRAISRDGELIDPATASNTLAKWDSPEHDGALLSEQSDYHDFETCMMAKGWERVENLPYDIAAQSRRNYLESLYGEKYRSKTPQVPRPEDQKMPTDWDRLNN